MLALTVTPGQPDSLELRDVPEPEAAEGSIVVDALAVGLCGTDREIIAAEFGSAPQGRSHLVVGHENLGRVAQAPAGSGFSAGDLVVGMVRRPDPDPCPACAAGEWDMCLNGRYTEHGIEALDGFARERWRAEPEELIRLDESLVRVGVLLEPATILAKAWEQIERIGERAFFAPRTVAVTGAGPVGLLAALLGVQRGLDVHVFDLQKGGLKAELVGDLGATYHAEPLPESGLVPDVVLECTGVPSVVLDAMQAAGRNSITCLAGVSSAGDKTPVDLGALSGEAVMGNKVVFGTVNANRRHYLLAAEALEKADGAWLERLISRRVALTDFAEAFEGRGDDVKVVLDLGGQ